MPNKNERSWMIENEKLRQEILVLNEKLEISIIERNALRKLIPPTAPVTRVPEPYYYVMEARPEQTPMYYAGSGEWASQRDAAHRFFTLHTAAGMVVNRSVWKVEGRVETCVLPVSLQSTVRALGVVHE